MNAGRKPKALVQVPALVDAHLDQPKIANAMVQMRADGVAEQATRDQRLARFSEQVGIAKYVKFQDEMCAAARIRVFLEIKESNDFKDLPIVRADGNVRPAQTLDELCPLVFGKSYRVMAEEAQNFDALGEGAFEAVQRMGLNRRQLRLIRSLPDAQRTAVAEAVQAESKAEVVAIIEDLAAQLAQAQNEATEVKGELKASEQLLEEKNAKIDSQKLALKKHLVAATDWPDAFKILMDQAQFATKNIKIQIGSLVAVSQEAIHAEPKGPDEEASLTRAREVLAAELLTAHRSCAQLLEQAGLLFHNTLGAFASESLYHS